MSLPACNIARPRITMAGRWPGTSVRPNPGLDRGILSGNAPTRSSPGKAVAGHPVNRPPTALVTDGA